MLYDMTRAISPARFGSEYDDFLFSPIGEDRNGLMLSVVSMLARLNLDPWHKAASFAELPRITRICISSTRTIFTLGTAARPS
jgi:hypothetical protein